MKSPEIRHGDALEVLDEFPENHFHAVVSDPPYGIEFMNEKWDAFAPKEYEEWCEQWATKLLRVLKPGGHVVAFSGDRTHHRLFSGVENAGFEIRHTLTWLFGNGFPKGPRLETYLEGDDAEKWGTWRGLLKPAAEFAVLARSPLADSSAARNQVEHGVGNLNVEACRVPIEDDGGSGNWSGTNQNPKEDIYGSGLRNEGESSSHGRQAGRFPPTVALDETATARLDHDVGELDAGGGAPKQDSDERRNVYGDFGGDRLPGFTPGSGGPSRFYYTPKADRDERTAGGRVENDHPTVKPLELMRWYVRLTTAEGQRVLDPFVGSGTTAVACMREDRDVVGIEKNPEYVEIARERVRVEAEKATLDDFAKP